MKPVRARIGPLVHLPTKRDASVALSQGEGGTGGTRTMASAVYRCGGAPHVGLRHDIVRTAIGRAGQQAPGEFRHGREGCADQLRGRYRRDQGTGHCTGGAGDRDRDAEFVLLEQDRAHAPLPDSDRHGTDGGWRLVQGGVVGPGHLPSEIFELCNTRIVHNVKSIANLRAMKATGGDVSEEMWNLVPSLGVGQAVVSTPQYRDPVVVNVRPCVTMRQFVE